MYILADDLISSKMPHDDRIAGMAVYLTMYCKREGKVLHLEDVYVLPQYRSKLYILIVLMT